MFNFIEKITLIHVLFVLCIILWFEVLYLYYQISILNKTVNNLCSLNVDTSPESLNNVNKQQDLYIMTKSLLEKDENGVLNVLLQLNNEDFYKIFQSFVYEKPDFCVNMLVNLEKNNKLLYESLKTSVMKKKKRLEDN